MSVHLLFRLNNHAHSGFLLRWKNYVIEFFRSLAILRSNDRAFMRDQFSLNLD